MTHMVQGKSADSAASGPHLLEVESVKKYFPLKKGLMGFKLFNRAIDGVSFTVERGETFGLVGESGCGKTTLGRVILRLTPPTEGRVLFEGTDLTKVSPEQMRDFRRQIQVVFQDPYASLNPRMTIGSIIAEPLVVHGGYDHQQRKDRVQELLRIVGLHSDDERRYAHEFSGGQRQRIGIARALALNPELIICDEPVSALDVSIQSQVLNLLQELQEGFGLTYIFISHSLSVVEHVSDRVAVMYLGKIVEIGAVDDIFNNPMHPYTKALISAIPIPDPKRKSKRIVLEGDVPSPVSPPPGCRFSSRCWMAQSKCQASMPELEEASSGHKVACYYAD